MSDIATTIAVAGAGPVGLLAAVMLADAGFDVALAGPRSGSDDRRTAALMRPALDALDRIGILARIAPHAAEMRTMRIVDGSRRLLRAPTVTFRASEIGEEAFGLNVPNAALTAALDDAVDARPSIRRIVARVNAWEPHPDRVDGVIEDGRRLTARLVVAADGRASPARAAAGISVEQRPLEQSALVLAFGHERDHAFTSTEIHTEDGPFTQVPLPGRRSSLVWVGAPATIEELAMLDDEELAARVEERMQSILGRVTMEPGRQVYRLASASASRLAGRRIVLAGEAAHALPPIGAQGLNLGFRDVADLVGALAERDGDPGEPDLLAAYERRRRPDVLSRAAAVRMLNRSLVSDLLPFQMARVSMLGLLGASAPLRALFMREGMSPGSGLRQVLRPLREKVGR